MTGTKLWGQLAPRADGQPGWLDGEPAAATGQPKRADYHDRVAWKQANAPAVEATEGVRASTAHVALEERLAVFSRYIGSETALGSTDAL